MTFMETGRRRVIAALAAAAVIAIGVPSQLRADEQHPPFADASRLVTIGGSLTEIVFALGEEDRLVGRDSTSIYPEAVFAIPDVGYMRRLSPEGVLSVEPTAILAIEGSGPPEAMEVLEKASVPVVLVPESFDREGILAKIAAVGAALDMEEEASALAARVGDDIAAAERQAAGIEARKRVIFILSMTGGRVLASGRDTAADGIIEMAGAVNAIDGFKGYKQVSEEAVIEARPDVIVMMERSGGAGIGTSEDELFAHPAIAPTPAGRNRALLRVDGAFMLGFGPRTAGAIRELSTALYGASVAN